MRVCIVVVVVELPLSPWMGRLPCGALALAVGWLGYTSAQTVAQSCPAGFGHSAAASGGCERCPSGKQSANESAVCNFCSSTMRPNPEQSGCECQALHFSPWAEGNGCTPCAAVPLSRVQAPKRESFMKLVDLEQEQAHKPSTSAVTCTGPSAGVMELNGITALGVGGSEAVSACGKFDHAECAGGAPGAADLCPNDGAWLSPNRILSIKGNTSQPAPMTASERAAMFLIRECLQTRGGGPSRCQHWSRCVQDADEGEEPDDPWAPYVSDREFAEWLTKPSSAGKTCTSELDSLPGGGRSGWGLIKSDGVNCCAPGFEGELCAFCTPPLMKIKDVCVACDGEEGWNSVRWPKVLTGSVLALFFTVWVMKKAATTFEDADGTATIAVFYFQIIALMFKDRAAVLAVPLLREFMSAMELGFLVNTEKTCMVKLSFFDNFYFEILSTVGMIGTIYACFIWMTSMTATKSKRQGVLQDIQTAKNKKVASHIMAHIHLFESIEPEYRQMLVDGLKVRHHLSKGYRLLKEGDKEFFFIVVNGALEIESQGKKVTSIKAGQHFGVESLFHRRPVSCTVRVMQDDTVVMTMRRKVFRLISHDFSDAAKESMLATLDHHPGDNEDDRTTDHLCAGATLDPDDDARDSPTHHNTSIDMAAEYQPVNRSAPPLSIEELIAFVSRNPVFAAASASTEKKQALIEIIANRLERRFFDAKEVVIRKGEEATHMYFVTAGAAEVFSTESRMMDDLEPLAILEEGRMFGESALLSDDLALNASAFVRAKVEMETYVLSKDSLKESLKEFPKMGLAFDQERRKREAILKKRLAKVGLDGEDADLGVAESMGEMDKQIELEEKMERILVVSYERLQRKNAYSTELVITHPCCIQLHKITRPVGFELKRIYAAANNPTGIAAGVLEIMIALYGPTTLNAMGMLFCRQLASIDPVTGVTHIRDVLVQDSTVECSGAEYNQAARFAWFVLFVFCICVPVTMMYASRDFNDAVKNGGNLDDAKDLARARHHSSWRTMTAEQRKVATEKCAHDLRLDIMGSSSFMLSSFQMSVVTSCAYWYPQWHLLRRTFLNYIYFDGLRSGDNTTTIFVTPYDWRVVIAVVLVCSSVIQQHFKPFRGSAEDELESWSLHFLTIVTVVDVADEVNSVYVVVLLSVVFSAIASKALLKKRAERDTAQQAWHRIRKLQVQEGKVIASENGLVQTKTVSGLLAMIFNKEQREMSSMIDGENSTRNPLQNAARRVQMSGQSSRSLAGSMTIMSNPMHADDGEDDDGEQPHNQMYLSRMAGSVTHFNASDAAHKAAHAADVAAHKAAHAADAAAHAAAHAADKALITASVNIEGLTADVGTALNHLDREELTLRMQAVDESRKDALSAVKHVDDVMTKGKLTKVAAHTREIASEVTEAGNLVAHGASTRTLVPGGETRRRNSVETAILERE